MTTNDEVAQQMEADAETDSEERTLRRLWEKDTNRRALWTVAALLALVAVLTR